MCDVIKRFLQASFPSASLTSPFRCHNHSDKLQAFPIFTADGRTAKGVRVRFSFMVTFAQIGPISSKSYQT